MWLNEGSSGASLNFAGHKLLVVNPGGVASILALVNREDKNPGGVSLRYVYDK
jgi:hypothetical protein